MSHEFWGELVPDWAGFSSAVYFVHPFFANKKVEVFLGDEFDENLEEVATPPSAAQLTEFAATYQDFTANSTARLTDLQQRVFEWYRQHYAGFYESAEQSGQPPLTIDTVAEHNPYIRDIGYLRISPEATLRVSIYYDLDSEHGLEIKFVGGQVAAVGGIADT